MNVPDELFYTESHEWLRQEGENARIGITDHAQAELTDVVYVELPKVGAQVKARGQIAVVESVKAASDIYAPVTGTVVDVNKALEGNPALINTDPFGEGWIFVLKMDSPNGALKASVDAGEELIRDAQRELEALPSNQYTDSLFQFGDALRDLLDQFRA